MYFVDSTMLGDMEEAVKTSTLKELISWMGDGICIHGKLSNGKLALERAHDSKQLMRERVPYLEVAWPRRLLGEQWI